MTSRGGTQAFGAKHMSIKGVGTIVLVTTSTRGRSVNLWDAIVALRQSTGRILWTADVFNEASQSRDLLVSYLTPDDAFKATSILDNAMPLGFLIQACVLDRAEVLAYLARHPMAGMSVLEHGCFGISVHTVVETDTLPKDVAEVLTDKYIHNKPPTKATLRFLQTIQYPDPDDYLNLPQEDRAWPAARPVHGAAPPAPQATNGTAYPARAAPGAQGGQQQPPDVAALLQRIGVKAAWLPGAQQPTVNQGRVGQGQSYTPPAVHSGNGTARTARTAQQATGAAPTAQRGAGTARTAQQATGAAHTAQRSAPAAHTTAAHAARAATTRALLGVLVTGIGLEWDPHELFKSILEADPEQPVIQIFKKPTCQCVSITFSTADLASEAQVIIKALEFEVKLIPGVPRTPAPAARRAAAPRHEPPPQSSNQAPPERPAPPPQHHNQAPPHRPTPPPQHHSQPSSGPTTPSNMWLHFPIPSDRRSVEALLDGLNLGGYQHLHTVQAGSGFEAWVWWPYADQVDHAGRVLNTYAIQHGLPWRATTGVFDEWGPQPGFYAFSQPPQPAHMPATLPQPYTGPGPEDIDDGPRVLVPEDAPVQQYTVHGDGDHSAQQIGDVDWAEELRHIRPECFDEAGDGPAQAAVAASVTPAAVEHVSSNAAEQAQEAQQHTDAEHSMVGHQTKGVKRSVPQSDETSPGDSIKRQRVSGAEVAAESSASSEEQAVAEDEAAENSGSSQEQAVAEQEAAESSGSSEEQAMAEEMAAESSGNSEEQVAAEGKAAENSGSSEVQAGAEKAAAHQQPQQQAEDIIDVWVTSPTHFITVKSASKASSVSGGVSDPPVVKPKSGWRKVLRSWVRRCFGQR